MGLLASSPGPIFILKLVGQKLATSLPGPIFFCPANFNITIGPGDEARGLQGFSPHDFLIRGESL